MSGDRLKLLNEDVEIQIVIGGESMFEGDAAELKRILKEHKDFIDYIDNHEDGGEL